MDRQGWIDAAKPVVLQLLGVEKAVTWHELVAKLGEVKKSDAIGGRVFNPHILTESINELERGGFVDQYQHVTRGGYVFKIVCLPRMVRGNARAVTDAAGAKGLAMAKYLSMSQSQRVKRQAIGAGLEDVLSASIARAAGAGGGVGYSMLGKGTVSKEVQTVAGVKLPGTVDNAAVMTVTDLEAGTVETFWVIFEAKNIRDWVYPSKRELYQLLHKAAVLQVARPDLRVLPVLVARKIQYTTYRFAQQVGFLGVEPSAQFVTSGTDPEKVEAIRAVLGFNLAIGDRAGCPWLYTRLTDAIPKMGPRMADRWSQIAPEIVDLVADLRSPSGTYFARKERFDEICDIVIMDDATRDSGGYFVDPD